MNNLIKVLLVCVAILFGYKTFYYYRKYKDGYGLHWQRSVDPIGTEGLIKPDRANKKQRRKLLSEMFFAGIFSVVCLFVSIWFLSE